MNNYVCENQMDIFDFIDTNLTKVLEKTTLDKQASKQANYILCGDCIDLIQNLPTA